MVRRHRNLVLVALVAGLGLAASATGRPFPGPSAGEPRPLPGEEVGFPLPLSLAFLGMYRKTMEIEGEIAVHAGRYGVDPELARALCIYESGGNGDLTSGAGARGYFQVMPATFRTLGVRTNVEAGIKYYASMLRLFGREDLALAAYNGGPAHVQRSRPMRMETVQYVLGIAYYKNILREHGPRVREEAGRLGLVTVSEGDDWWTLSQRTGSPIVVLRMFNPFLASRPLRPGYRVAYPTSPVPIPLEAGADGTYYRARVGDHYLMLAFIFGTSADRFREANGLWHVDLLLPGRRVRVPLEPELPAEWSDLQVRAGEDLGAVASRAGVSPWGLIRDNGVWDQRLTANQSLRVNRAAPPPQPEYVLYRVRRGDTLSGIAQRHGVALHSLRSMNGLSAGHWRIQAGDLLKVPAS